MDGWCQCTVYRVPCAQMCAVYPNLHCTFMYTNHSLYIYVCAVYPLYRSRTAICWATTLIECCAVVIFYIHTTAHQAWYLQMWPQLCTSCLIRNFRQYNEHFTINISFHFCFALFVHSSVLLIFLKKKILRCFTFLPMFTRFMENPLKIKITWNQ